MNETWRKPTTGRQSPSLSDKWHGILYMPSRIDEAGHTKAFDYPVAEHWGEPKCSAPRGLDPTTHRFTVERTTNWTIPAPPEDHITPGPQQGDLLPRGGWGVGGGGGVGGKEQPRHEKATPIRCKGMT